MTSITGKMDDELERLLHELAGQERERLRRKCSEQIEMTTCQNRFENHIFSLKPMVL